ncbi:MAG: HlyC/CorC family transporter [Betaproteobacteria bacterium]|nr:HlyC/CorC family transporter [Betaproteobacteria bacterium]
MDAIPLSAQFIALSILLLISAVFSIAETSMMALNRYRLKALVRKGNRGAIITTELLTRTDRLLGVILLGNNLINAAAAVLVSVITVRLFGENEIALAAGTLVVTFLILVFSEITPKVIGAAYAEQIALPLAFLLKPLLKALYPVVWFVNLFVQSLLWITRLKPANTAVNKMTPDELRTLVLESGNYIPKKHQSILLNLFDLESITVDDVMTPRNQIEVIDIDAPSDVLRQQIATAYHRRIALYQGQSDNIIGVILLRKVLALNADDEINATGLREIMREPYFVPSGTPLFTQLQQFQENQDRLCFVVDEYGELMGLLTLEDIVEELIGEFATHSPLQPAHFHRQPDGSYVVEGGSLLRELNRKLGYHFPLDGPKTLNGLILEHFRDIPEPGTSATIANHRIVVMQTQDRIVKSVRLVPPTIASTQQNSGMDDD